MKICRLCDLACYRVETAFSDERHRQTAAAESARPQEIVTDHRTGKLDVVGFRFRAHRGFQMPLRSDAEHMTDDVLETKVGLQAGNRNQLIAPRQHRLMGSVSNGGLRAQRRQEAKRVVAGQSGKLQVRHQRAS